MLFLIGTSLEETCFYLFIILKFKVFQYNI